MVDITRREALAALGCLGASLGVSGCSTPITPFCPTDPTISDPSSPLTIDVHTHVFNGSDLQVKGFFDSILAINNKSLKGFGEILQQLASDFAPTAAQEIAELQNLEVVLRACDTRGSTEVMYSYREEGYRRAVRELKTALRRAQARRLGRSSYISPEIANQINNLPSAYSDYKVLRRHNLRATPESITVSGAMDFLIRNFQFRYVNVHEYLLEYSQGKSRKLDLVVAHLVDFDWAIGNGIPTTTSLSDQVKVMERISQLTGGRVQCFAPYDPYKEVAHSYGLAESSFDFVKDAVSNHGFIGVKVYPPMGFAPLGNAGFPDTFWDGSPLPTSLPRSQLGLRLDNALSTLYSWCLANGVPIMAHTSRSNGPSLKFEELTYAQYWDYALSVFPGLRVDLGHFGVYDLAHKTQPKLLSDLMETANGQFLYADSAYFAEILSNQPELEAYLAARMRYSSNNGAYHGPAALAQRLMYGTDWEMVVLEGTASDQYLQRFEAMYSRFDRDPSLGANGKLSDRFFGINAAIFLGLGTGQPNRQRLDHYYGLGSKPAWMSKVDKVTAAAA